MSERNTGSVRTIAVVGGGAAAWTAAIALDRAFTAVGVAVTVVETPSTTPPQAAIATLPELAGFHALLGLGERALLRGAGATFSLGQQFVGWSGDDVPPFLHAYGETGRAVGDLPFVQAWVKARANGLPVAFGDFALAGVAARHGRLPTEGRGPALAHGYHLDARGYEQVLRRHAVALGIAGVADAAPTPEVAGDRIVALRLADDRTIVADLYVDATGPAARLIGALPGSDAPASSFCDRILLASAPPLSPLPLYGRVAAHRAGWIGLSPLEGRTAIAMPFAGEHMTDGEAARMVGPLAGLRGVGDIVVTALDHRSRDRPWIGNCVAVGEAAHAGDPIDAVAAQAHQIAIAHLVALFPVDRSAMREAALYNEEVAAHQRRLRDFQAAHYRLNRRRGEPFWDAARATPIGDDLAGKIDLFAARGMVAQYNNETFNPDSWEAILVGHGVIPRSWDPQVDALPDAEVAGALQAILGSIRRDVSAMEPHEAARRRVATAR